MDYVFPAVFHKNEDGTYTISYPDLEGCISEGKSLENALYMAQSALTQWLNYMIDKQQHIPKASAVEEIKVNNDEFVNFILTDIKDEKAVRRTVSIPKWMDTKVYEANISLSGVLQEALKKKLSKTV
ncbi:MAG: type II toxin-antitoxin system HicB family antitoxin [Termitinemataceae bacterium]|nr:MAG: type II toxin-antitoxin system HicB family antitoxin [Termitinemataceae bacterium]